MAATPQYKLTDTVDFAVIGSGAAGGVVAKELSTNGFRVVVLEQGDYKRPSSFDHDEYMTNIEHALTNDARTQPQTFRKTDADVAKPSLAAVAFISQPITGAFTKSISSKRRKRGLSPAQVLPTGQ